MKKSLILLALIAIFFSACANHNSQNSLYESSLKHRKCDEKFFTAKRAQVEANDDVIYTGLNAGAMARNCLDFEQSNYFFDKAEEAYKFDVDLQSAGKRVAKGTAAMLLNEGVGDYEGRLYERIMVNVYKGLNFMGLGEFENARVEFNRALLRQQKAKEFFKKEIEANKEEFDKARQDPNYAQNMGANYGVINAQYAHLLKDFTASQNFTNPYATYLASLFFFLEGDFLRAADLFKEVAALQKNGEIAREFAIFERAATSFSRKKLKRQIFVVYESGFSMALDEFAVSLPFLTPDGLVSFSLALPMLKARENSHEFLVANGVKTQELVSFDEIIAAEFKANLPITISKALSSAIIKTTLNAVVAKNDPTGGFLSLATSVFNAANTHADTRQWQALPKFVNVVMVENTGELKLVTPRGVTLYANDSLDAKKDVLVLVKSYAEYGETLVWVVQK